MTLAKEVVDDAAVVAAVEVVEVEHLGRRLHLTQRQSPMWRKFPKRHFLSLTFHLTFTIRIDSRLMRLDRRYTSTPLYPS